MISSGQIILDRWRIDGELYGHPQIRRWMVWDLGSDTEYILFHPTASELLRPEQPHTFVNTHRQQHAEVVNTHENIPFAIYPLHNSELRENTEYDNDTWLIILDAALQETTTVPLDYLEVVERNGTTVIQRLGHVHQRPKIGVNPLYHPDDQNSAAFSMAMMCCLHTSKLKWNTRSDFEYWLTERHFADLLKSMSPPLQNLIESIFENTSCPNTSLPNISLTLSSIEHVTLLPATNPSTSPTVESSATRVQHLPEYLLMVNEIQAKLIAKDLATVLNVPEQAILEQLNEGGPILLGGASSQTSAQAMASECDNIPVNIEITHRNGSFSTALLLGASALTTGMGVGILALTGSLVGLVVPVSTIPILWWLRSNWMTILNRKWKRFLTVGLDLSEVNSALRAARRRILVSDLPPSAIRELLQSVDDLEASGRSDSDTRQIADTICTPKNVDQMGKKTDISQLESKALQSVL